MCLYARKPVGVGFIFFFSKMTLMNIDSGPGVLRESEIDFLYRKNGSKHRVHIYALSI